MAPAFPLRRTPLTTLLLAVALLAPAAASAQQRATGDVRGAVTDAATGAPLRATVTVQAPPRAAVADEAGRFLIRDLPAGSVTIRGRALGYDAGEVVVQVVVGAEVEARMSLNAVARTLAAVRTEARRPERELAGDAHGTSVVTISSRDLRAVPVIGEADLLRSLTLLPGVAARSDYTAGFNIRGGESDQSAVLVDGFPLFSPFHLGGLFSTFIDATVSTVDVHAGAMPASYGGRLSGIIDVGSAEDTRPGVHGASELSLISSSLTLGGALPRARGSWNLAVRRTYADAVADVLLHRGAFPYHFQDGALHASMLLPGGGSIAITGYTGRDLLDVPPDNSSTNSSTLPNDGSIFSDSSHDHVRLDWGNGLLGVKLVRPIGERARIEQRLAYSTFGTTFEQSDQDPLNFTQLTNRIDQLQLAGSVADRLGSHGVRAGYELSYYRTRYRELLPIDRARELPGRLDQPSDTMFRQRLVTGALFAEDEWAIGDRLVVRPGVRAERVADAGWARLSPRLSVRYSPAQRLALTLAGGRYAQWVHAIRNEDLPIRIFDVWLASDRMVPVATSSDLVTGMELRLSPVRLLRVEAYGKRYSNLPEPESTVDVRLRPSSLRYFGGTSYGVEVYATQLDVGHFGGWISYSYGVSTRQRGDERYWPGHDRRHVANIVASFRPTERYLFGARFGVASGTPYTGWAGTYSRWLYNPLNGSWRAPGIESSDADEPVRGVRNGERYPMYERLDLSARRRFQRGRMGIEPYVSVVNVLNRNNVFLYTFDSEMPPPVIHEVSQLPFLPSIGVRVEF